MLDVGLLHHLEELARIGAEALDVAPLPLGIDRIERRLDFPEPDSPVITISLSRGSSMSKPLRLCSRAPRTEMVERPSGEDVPQMFDLVKEARDGAPQACGTCGAACWICNLAAAEGWNKGGEG